MRNFGVYRHVWWSLNDSSSSTFILIHSHTVTAQGLQCSHSGLTFAKRFISCSSARSLMQGTASCKGPCGCASLSAWLWLSSHLRGDLVVSDDQESELFGILLAGKDPNLWTLEPKICFGYIAIIRNHCLKHISACMRLKQPLMNTAHKKQRRTESRPTFSWERIQRCAWLCSSNHVLRLLESLQAAQIQDALHQTSQGKSWLKDSVQRW